jgi:anti-sigma B factor antagonist
MTPVGELGLRVEEVAGRTVVHVSGDIDIATVDQLEQALTAALDDGATDLLVDLSGVPFLDSTGIGVIVTVERRLQDAEGRFALRGLQALPRRVLEIGGLLRVLAIEE